MLRGRGVFRQENAPAITSKASRGESRATEQNAFCILFEGIDFVDALRTLSGVLFLSYTFREMMRTARNSVSTSRSVLKKPGLARTAPDSSVPWC